MRQISLSNEERRRHYGIRVGDTVREHGKIGIVTKLSTLDNNCVYVMFSQEQKCVAEWCEVLEKIEDK